MKCERRLTLSHQVMVTGTEVGDTMISALGVIVTTGGVLSAPPMLGTAPPWCPGCVDCCAPTCGGTDSVIAASARTRQIAVWVKPAGARNRMGHARSRGSESRRNERTPYHNACRVAFLADTLAAQCLTDFPPNLDSHAFARIRIPFARIRVNSCICLGCYAYAMKHTHQFTSLLRDRIELINTCSVHRCRCINIVRFRRCRW